MKKTMYKWLLITMSTVSVWVIIFVSLSQEESPETYVNSVVELDISTTKEKLDNQEDVLREEVEEISSLIIDDNEDLLVKELF